MRERGSLTNPDRIQGGEEQPSGIFGRDPHLGHIEILRGAAELVCFGHGSKESGYFEGSGVDGGRIRSLCVALP